MIRIVARRGGSHLEVTTGGGVGRGEEGWSPNLYTGSE